MSAPRPDSTAHNDSPGVVEMFGCPFDRVDMTTAIARVEAAIADRSTLSQSCGVNMDQLLKMQQEPGFREIVLQCEQITADGQPIVWMSRLLGDPLPARVPSVDIMLEMLPVAAAKGYRIFMLGTREDILQEARANLQAQYPGLQIVGTRNGYFNADDEDEIVAAINAARADMLLIAISSPKKEQFVERNRSSLDVPFVMGVGGAFDIIAGRYSRAPKWVQQGGIEWAWRFAQEPRRMAPRVLSGMNLVPILARELWGRRRERRKIST